MTVEELVDAWLVEATKDVEVATKRSYEDAMRYVRTRLGKKPVQLTEDDVDALITWMLTEARRIGGKLRHRPERPDRRPDSWGACAPCSNSASGVRS